MKILYLVSSLRRSGPILVLQNIIRNLPQLSNHNIYIIKLCKDECERSITHEFIKDGVTIIELNLSKQKLELRSNYCAKIVRNEIFKIHPDIIHVHGYQPAIIASKLDIKIPITITLHNIPEEDFESSKGKFMGRYMVHRFKKALKHFDRAVAISKIVKEEHESLTAHMISIDLIYNGVDLSSGSNIDKIDFKRRLGINKDDIVFVVIGSLTDRKDPLCIIKAFKIAFTSIDNVKLLFLGKGVLMEECLNLVGDDERIKMIGWTPDVSSYLEIADYSISASHSEGFGLNVIESLSKGTPVILTDIPVFDEFRLLYPSLIPLTFKCGNYEDLAVKLTGAYKQSYSVDSLVEDVNDRFSSMRMGKNYMKLYEEIVKSYAK